MRWGLVLCTCNGTLQIDPKRIGTYLGLDADPTIFSRLPRDEIHTFMALVNRERFDRIAVACCGPHALFQEAVGAAGGDPEQVLTVNLRESCFWAHPPGPEVEAKAARLLRAAMRGAATPRLVPEIPLKVGGRVLIATDSPAGLQLASRLAGVAQPLLILDECSSAFDAESLHPLPWKTNWGRVIKVEGSLGHFQVTLERTQPLHLETCIHCRRCIPVCHTSAITPALRLRTELCDQCGDCLKACADVGAIKIPRRERETIRVDQVVVIAGNGAPAAQARTGYHLVQSLGPGAIDALAWKIFSLMGEFGKPQSVAYTAESCAGGAANHESCGICIQVCPYQAIGRDPKDHLRVSVDALACEGCGACVSACPTSALTFTDPPTAELYARMTALLAPLPGVPPATPLVLAFYCPEKGQASLGEAGRGGPRYPATVLPVPVACLRHVSEAAILAAFRLGASGVALLGCEACPHGERDLLYRKLDVARSVLDAFGLGSDRLRVITGGEEDSGTMLEAVERFAASVELTPVSWDGRSGLPPGNRDVIVEAVRAFMEATGREPGRVRVPEGEPFAYPEVRVEGCTLCRSCVNVCPTHAFRFSDERQGLELKQLACVNCDLCVKACPERVITLHPELYLERSALDWQVILQDEMIRCLKCERPFINRKALEILEGKLFSMEAILDTFAGSRRNLLRMCPDCRAVAALLEVQQGWEP